MQLDPRRQLGPHIRVDGGGRPTLERLVDGAAIIVRERLEGVGNRDELVVRRVLRGELRRHRIGIRRRARNRQGAVDERRIRRGAGVRWRLLLGGGKADAADKCQRERAGAHEITSHGCLLFLRPRRRYPPPPHTNSYSITSSARASSVDGTSRPSALAAARLMTNSNLVGCITGRSDGLAPLRMRPV